MVVGPVSSLFDFLTFYVLLAILQADEALYFTQAGSLNPCSLVFLTLQRDNRCPLHLWERNDQKPQESMLSTSFSLFAFGTFFVYPYGKIAD